MGLRRAFVALSFAACAACVAGACAKSGTTSDGCPEGQTSCGGTCVDTAKDPANCGACGSSCGTTLACSNGACVSTCPADQTKCAADGGAFCTSTKTDPQNCGACAKACDKGFACAGGACQFSCTMTACAPEGGAPVCTDTKTDPQNCGGCGKSCPPGATCTGGACGYGKGTDGILQVPSGTMTLSVSRANADAMQGSAQITISNAMGSFSIGNVVLVHQTQASTGSVGQYEYAVVTSVSPTTLVVASPLANPYTTSMSAKAQVMVVPQFTDVMVANGATLAALAWNGTLGGILAFDATGKVEIAGNLSMTGAGFRGQGHNCLYRCAQGFQGESARGPAALLQAQNGAGGGGGTPGQDCGGGGGGGNGTAGASGSNGSCGACSPCPHLGGAGGAVHGTPQLDANALPGGAGGEGGGDEDGGNPGAGGAGGGVVLVRAGTVVVTGAAAASGTNGASGNQGGCGGTGSGMAGGGAGAGGAILFVAAGSIDLGTMLVTARGGAGGNCAGGGTNGGAGGDGRIAVKAPAVTGSSSPALTKL